MLNIYATIRRIDNIYNMFEKINILYQAGINGLRFNLSKASNIEVLKRDFCEIKSKYDKIKIMLDIPFPGDKTRLLIENNSFNVFEGQQYFLHDANYKSRGKFNNIKVDCINKRLDKDNILIYDGGIGRFRISNVLDNNTYIIEAENDFTLLDRKSLTYGDKRIVNNNFDYSVIKGMEIDSIACSFVEKKEDIKKIRMVLNNSNINIIAKIETMKGVNNINAIIENADGIMIARGDLGLNIPLEKFCDTQIGLSQRAKEKNKQCIIATDIMQSMRKSCVPSRADLSDMYFIKMISPDSIVISLQLATSNNIKETISLIRTLVDF